MAEKKLMALDIGSSWVRAVVGSVSREGQLNVDTICERPSEGIKSSQIVNIEACLRTINSVIQEAEIQSGSEVNSVVFGIGGNITEIIHSSGVTGSSGKDHEITHSDIMKTLEDAKSVKLNPNMEILHTLVQDFIVDGRYGIKEPINTMGHRLETQVLLITGDSEVLKNYRKTLTRAGFDDQRVLLNALADAEVVLSNEEKEIGTILINIGSQTTNMIAYANGSVCYCCGISMGSDDVTNDIAYVLNKTHPVSETVKIESGCCFTPSISPNEMVMIPQVQGLPIINMPKRELGKIIEPRMAEIFSILKNELDKNCPSAQFGGGVVLVGGGALLSGVSELNSEIFRLQSRIGFPTALSGLDRNYIDPKYTTVLGLLQNEANRYYNSLNSNRRSAKGSEWRKDSEAGVFSKLKRFLKIVSK